MPPRLRTAQARPPPPILSPQSPPQGPVRASFRPIATTPRWRTRSSCAGRSGGVRRAPTTRHCVQWLRPHEGRSSTARPQTRTTPTLASCSSWTCSRTRRVRDCTLGTRWATSAPTSTHASSACAATWCCTRWATTRSGCQRRNMPAKLVSTPASIPSRTSPTCHASWLGSGLGTTISGRWPPPMSSTTAGRNGSSCRSSIPGTTLRSTRRARSLS